MLKILKNSCILFEKLIKLQICFCRKKEKYKQKANSN